jgi:single-strand DNA-binding protein
MQTSQIIGRLGRDAELKSTQQGTPFITLAVAVNTGWGENKKTVWWDVAYFGNRAEKVCQYLEKGTQVFIDGDFDLKQFTTKQGEERITPSIRADRIELLSSAVNGDKSDKPPREKPVTKPKAQAADGDFEDDIPF